MAKSTASPYESPTRQHRLSDWIHLHQVSSLDRCLQSKTSCEVHRPLLIALMGTVWFGVPGQDGVGLKLGHVETRVFKVSSPAPRLLGLGEGRAAPSGFFPEKILCVCFPHVGEEKPPRSFSLLCYFCWKPEEMARGLTPPPTPPPVLQLRQKSEKASRKGPKGGTATASPPPQLLCPLAGPTFCTLDQRSSSLPTVLLRRFK